MPETLDETAQRIAEKGRDALLDRLRPAFEEAAAAHADFLELDADKLERMVQQAVDRADGLQWRRALAAVACEELGIGLGEALGHPAVARAQAIVGAPSYEESLAAITEASPKPPTDEADATDAELSEAATEGRADSAEDGPDAGDAGERQTAEASGETSEASGEASDGQGSSELRIRVAVVHLDGLPRLDGEGEIELRFSDRGLDVGRRDGATLVAFLWTEIHAIEVRSGRGAKLRRRPAGARLLLSTTGRRARFDAPDADRKELQERLAPALAKIARRR